MQQFLLFVDSFCPIDEKTLQMLNSNQAFDEIHYSRYRTFDSWDVDGYCESLSDEIQMTISYDVDSKTVPKFGTLIQGLLTSRLIIKLASRHCLTLIYVFH